MNQLTQKRGFETKKFSINETEQFLNVEHNTLKEKLKYKIDLIEIGNEIEYEADNLIVGKITMIFFLLISIGFFIAYLTTTSEKPGLLLSTSLISGILVIGGILVPNKDDILITKGSRIIRMFRTSPNEEQVMKFANNLIKLANDQKKSLLINFDLNEDQFSANIQWLRNMKLINDSESENLKAEYSLKKLI